ncbi:hypothetical protein Ancab_013724 [Ancistrocladus abbreviatus]
MKVDWFFLLLECSAEVFQDFSFHLEELSRLPKFEMVLAKSEANSKPVLAAEDIHIITVYGRIYCLQVDKVAMLLHCYRFYRDAVVPQGSLPIYSSKIAVSVVDNVLLIHQVDAKVKEATDHQAVLYGVGWTFLVPDLICDTASGLVWKIHLDLEAISASSSDVPLVLEFLQRRKLEAKKAKQLCLSIARTAILEHRPVSVVARAMEVLITSYSHAIKTGTYFKGVRPGKTLASSASHVSSPGIMNDESSKRTDQQGRSVITDFASGVVSVNQSSHFSGSDSEEEKVSFDPPSSHVGDYHVVGGAMEKAFIMGSETFVSNVQQHQLPGSSIIPLDTAIPEQLESQIASAAMSPDEIYQFVLAPVDEEMAGDPAYLVAIIVEFLHSANLERIKVHLNLYVLTVQLLARTERYAELGLFIINKIIEPSKEVAYQLLESGRQNSPTRKLGTDMLRHLSLHHDYILYLVQDGYLLEALRYARKHKVNTVRPSLFLNAARSSNNPQRLAAVLRFFSDFIPSFKNTSDHTVYCLILGEMNASVAAQTSINKMINYSGF